MRRILLFLALAPWCAKAATWYVSPSATAGSGSLGDPWPLQTALTNTATVVSGDTVLMRGGNYFGPGFVCNLVGVTVKSYPGEWAVLQDGFVGTLNTNMPNSSSSSTISIRGSEGWQAVSVIGIGNERMQAARVSNATNWTVQRGWDGSTTATHSSNDTVYLANVAIPYVSGTNNVFRDFEVTSPFLTNRVFTYGFSPSSGIDLHGKGNKAINLIIHDVGHPGIGFWDQGAGGEINGCQFWGVGHYDYTAGFNGTPRGTAIYSQNGGEGMAQIKNCIFHHVLTDGAEVFGETGPVQDFVFNGNISCANGTLVSLEIASGSTSTTNTWMTNNILMGPPTLSYVSLSNTAEYVSGNVMVNGGFALKETTASVLTNNDVFLTKNAGVGASAVQYSSTIFSSNNLSLTWDYNHYYIGDGASPFQWLFTSSEGTPHNNAGGDTLTFGGDNGHGWKAWTGFDAHSTCVTNWPTDYLRVKSFALDYDANRHFISVVCTTGATSTTIDLGTNGFANGDIYTLRDAQNYFTVIAQGVYSGSALSLPLNLTNIATLQGSVTNFVPQHTNVQTPGLFNAFVLDRTSGASSIVQLNVGKLIIQ